MNELFKNKLKAFAGDEGSDKYLSFLKFAEDLEEIGVNSNEDYIVASNICNILNRAYGTIDSGLLTKAFDNRKSMPLDNLNDYYYLVLMAVMDKKDITKVAYPSMFGALTIEHPEEYDMKKWSALVHKIYDATIRKKMDFDAALNYYANTLDKESGEDQSFRKWLTYYKNGENMKYSKEELENMQKDAGFQFSPLGLDFYQKTEKPLESKIDDAKHSANVRNDYDRWKKKLNGAIRRIDKLLRGSDEFIDPDKYEDLMNLLHTFDINVGKIRLQSTASDLTWQTASKFKKMGLEQASNELIKVAQEAPPIDQPIEDESMLGEQPEDLTPSAEPPGEVGTESPEIDIQPTEPEAEEFDPDPVDIKDIPLVGGAESGEYEALAGDITISDAADKLEEVAGMLADRRVIRKLTEFDIMLDKLGIASMFQELPEATSKLIDGYSYALTRVTKMLGMLSSGRQLLEATQNEGLPGTNEGLPQENEGLSGEFPTEEATPEDAIQEEFGGEGPAPEMETP